MPATGKVTDAGLLNAILLDAGTIAAIGHYGKIQVQIGLYANLVTWNSAIRWADLIESSFAGYSRFVDPFIESGPFMDAPGGNAVLPLGDFTFHNAGVGSATVQGFFVLGYAFSMPNFLRGGGDFGGGVSIPPGGDLVLSPSLTIASRY